MTGAWQATALEEFVERRGDPGALPPQVFEAYRRGDLRAARRHLLRHRSQEIHPERRVIQEEALRELRNWVEPAAPPRPFTFNGIGTRLIGRFQARHDGSFIATLWMCIVFVPFFPIRAYLVADGAGGRAVLGRTPLPPPVRVARWVVPSVWGVGAGAAVTWWLRDLGLVQW